MAAVATAKPASTGTANFSAWANVNLTALTEQVDNTTNVGNGGGIGVATGVKAEAGAYGNTTVSFAYTPACGLLSIAIKP